MRQPSQQISKIISFIAALLIIFIEFNKATPTIIIVLLPFAGVLILYNLYYLLNSGDQLRTFIFSAKGIFSILCFLLMVLLCCTPVNEFTHYLSKNDHPFRQYHWLVVSLLGILFLLSFVNYALRSPEGVWKGIVNLCEALGRLQTRHFLLLWTLWVFVIANLLSFAVFEHIPHVQDEIAQFLQAKIFARGNLTAPLPPIKDFFQYFYDNMIFANRWYSQYQPGHPVLLMLGMLLNIPWIINPLIAALSVPLLYKCAFHYYGENEARLSVVLFCVSPFVLFMSASYMNHVSSLLFLLLFLYGLYKSTKCNSRVYAFVAGLALGMLVNIRVGEACALGFLFGAVFFIHSLKGKKYYSLMVFSGTLLCMVMILLEYNYATNGNPFLFGYQVRWGNEHSLGFVNKPLMQAPVHTPLRGVIHTLSNFIALNQNLFEWPFPSLLPIVIYLIPFIFKKDRRDYLLLCGLLTAPVFYFFYFYQDLCLGPRFYYISLPFILPLTARAIVQIIKGIASVRGCSEKYLKHAFIALFSLAIVFSCIFRIPKLYSYYSDSFWKVDNKLMHKVRELKIEHAVIFQRSYDPNGDDLGSGFLYNSPWLDSSIIFARDLGERNAELIPFFPKRTYYLALRNEKGEVIIKPLQLSGSSH
jgi:hypothetical protein